MANKPSPRKPYGPLRASSVDSSEDGAPLYVAMNKALGTDGLVTRIPFLGPEKRASVRDFGNLAAPALTTRVAGNPDGLLSSARTSIGLWSSVSRATAPEKTPDRSVGGLQREGNYVQRIPPVVARTTPLKNPRGTAGDHGVGATCVRSSLSDAVAVTVVLARASRRPSIRADPRSVAWVRSSVRGVAVFGL